jgi:tetratricopeptide (TPR) repeat protein
MRDHFITLEAAEADILDCAAFIAERLQSAEGHADAISLIIPQYLKRGNVDLAAELANVVTDPHSRDKLLTQVAEQCARDGDDDYAMQLADAIEEDGLRDQAYENLALIKAEKGDFAKAEEIAGTMLHPDYVYAGIAFHKAAAGDTDGSDEALAKIEFPAAEASGLLQIAGMKVEKGDKADAVEFIDDALAAAEEIEHSEERIRLITEAAQLYREAGETERSVEAYLLARGDAEVLTNIHRDYFIVVWKRRWICSSIRRRSHPHLSVSADITGRTKEKKKRSRLWTRPPRCCVRKRTTRRATRVHATLLSRRWPRSLQASARPEAG